MCVCFDSWTRVSRVWTTLSVWTESVCVLLIQSSSSPDSHEVCVCVCVNNPFSPSLSSSNLLFSLSLVCFRKCCCWTEPDCEDLRTGSGRREHGYGLEMSSWVYDFIMLCLIGWRRFYFLSPQEVHGFGPWRTELDRSWSREKSATSTHSCSFTWSCESTRHTDI